MKEAGRIPEPLLAEIRARLPLEGVVARRVALKRAGQVMRGACPIHQGGDGCFLVDPRQNSFHCFSCGVHGDVFAFVMQTEGCTFREAVARCAAEAGIPMDLAPGERREALPPAPPPKPPRDRSGDIQLAWRMWDSARPIRVASPVARYLDGRGLWPLPDAAHDVLREADMAHPNTGRALHPVMLARVDDAAGVLTAVHRTYLAPGGFGKLQGVESAKLVWGVLPPGCAVRLGPAGLCMGVAEGIETALAGTALFGGMTVWSTISAGRMEDFMPPDICAELVVLADRDKPRVTPPRPEGQGLHSARVLAGRAAEAGRLVRIRVPVPPAEDYADVLMERAGVVA